MTNFVCAPRCSRNMLMVGIETMQFNSTNKFIFEDKSLCNFKALIKHPFKLSKGCKIGQIKPRGTKVFLWFFSDFICFH